MCSHCLSLDFFLSSLRSDSLLCGIVCKNRMIVSWTIKGNDAFPRFPQGRMMCAEFTVQNNSNHPESRVTTLHQRRLMPGCSSVFSSLSISLGTSCCHIIGLCAHSCLCFPLASRPSFRHRSLIRDECFSCFSQITTPFDPGNTRFMVTISDAHSSSASDSIMCSSFSKVPSTSQTESSQRVSWKRLSFTSLHSSSCFFSSLTLKYHWDVHF